MSEHQLMGVVIELANVLGWLVSHFRPARTDQGWRTPVSADGKGFPDLVIVRDRVIFAELKSKTGRLTYEQGLWREMLEYAGVEYHLWRPDHWLNGEIEDVLRRKV